MNRKSLLVLTVLAALTMGSAVVMAQQAPARRASGGEAPCVDGAACWGGHWHGHGGPGRGSMGPMSRLDTDKDGRISRAEAAADATFVARFDEFDLNKDGYVDKADFELRARQRRDEWFDRADTNKDGQLSRAEYEAAMERRYEDAQREREARRAEMFSSLDKNSDGRLSRDEVKDHPFLSREFDSLDKNKDGYLQSDEFQSSERAGQRSPRRGRR